MKSREKKPAERRMRGRRGLAAALAGAALAAGLAYGIETNMVELGRESDYDGTVRIERDASGRMTFVDQENPSPATLSALKAGKDAHGDLIGLGADDHTQYLNAARHAAAHTAAFNGALAIPADANGNATLAAHASDPAIHMNAAEDETVTGNWVFGDVAEFAKDILLTAEGAPGDQRLRFEDGGADAEILWKDGANRFEINRDVKLGSGLEVAGAGASSFAGNLGVGTAAPTLPLDVFGNAIFRSVAPAMGNAVNYTFGSRAFRWAFERESGGYQVLLRQAGNAIYLGADRFNGTADVPAALANGDEIIRIYASGRNPNGTHSAHAALRVYVDGAPSGDTVDQAVALNDGKFIVRASGGAELAGAIDQNGTAANTFAGLGRFDDGAAGSNGLADDAGDAYVEEDLEVDRFASAAALAVGSATYPGAGVAAFAGAIDQTGENIVSWQGKIVRRPAAVAIGAASAAITPSRSFLYLQSSGGSYTLTSAPTIPDPSDGAGTNGYELTLSKIDAGTVTLQDEATLAGSNVELGAATRAVGRGDMLKLVFFDGAWREVSWADH